MAFSVSFTFRAIDQYSKAMKSIAKATQGQAKAIEALNKVLKDNRQEIDSSAKSMKLLSGRFSRSASNVNKYTQAVKEATSVTGNHEKAVRKLGAIMGSQGGSRSRTSFNKLSPYQAITDMVDPSYRRIKGIGSQGYGAMSAKQRQLWKLQMMDYASGKGMNGYKRDLSPFNQTTAAMAAMALAGNSHSGLSSGHSAAWASQLAGYAKGQGMNQKMNYASFNKVSAAQAANNISGMNSNTGLNSTQSRAWSAQMARYRQGNFPGAKPKPSKKFWGKYGAGRDLDMVGFELTLMGGAILAPFAAGAKAVVDFDKNFAQVQKILAGSSSPTEIAKIRDDVLGLAKVYPMAMEGITSIMASAASGGIEAKDLKKFTSVAIEASGAFDMSAENTVQSMLAAKAGGKMSSKELFHYMNSTNMLDNLSSARGRDILEQTGNVFGMAKNIKMKSTDIAALMTTLIQNRIGNPDAQDTAANHLLSISAPSTLSSKAQGALIGLYNGRKPIKTEKQGHNILNGIRDSFDKDSWGATMDFLKRVSQLKHPMDVLGQIFRKGLPLQAILALTQSIKELEKNKKIANGNVDGSLTREYLAKMHTYAALWELVNNRINTFFVIVGDALNNNDQLKTALFASAGALNEILTKIEGLVKHHPMWTTAIVLSAVAIGVLVTGLGLAAFAIAGINKLIVAGAILMEAWTAVVSIAGTNLTLMEIAAGTATGALTLLEGAIAILTGPVGILAVAFALLYANWRPFRNSVNSFVGGSGLQLKVWFKEIAGLCDTLSAKFSILRPPEWLNGLANAGGALNERMLDDAIKSKNPELIENALRIYRPDYANKQLQSRSDYLDRAQKDRDYRRSPEGVNAAIKDFKGRNAADPFMMKEFSSSVKLDIKIDSPVPVSVKSSTPNTKVRMNTGQNMVPPKSSVGGW